MNGGEAHYGVDAGADLSTISEAEASRLGLKVHEAQVFDGGMASATQSQLELRWQMSWSLAISA